MPSSLPTRSPSVRARATHCSIVVPSSGMNGTTSVAPMRGCAPLWVFRSMLSRAVAIPAKAASTARSTGATKVTTVRLCDSSEDTSSTTTPSTAAIASRIFWTISGWRPSLKFGTHSTSVMARESECGARRSGARERVGEPPVHCRIPREERAVRERHIAAANRRHDAARFAHEQHARGEIPRCERQFPEGVEVSARDAHEIERRRSRATHPRGLLGDGGEVLEIQLEGFDLLEWEAGADQRARRIVDRRYRDRLVVAKGAAAACGREAITRWHLDDHAGHELAVHRSRDRDRVLRVAVQKVRRPVE